MAETVTLNNGVKMPLEGFGVWQIPDHAECERVVLDAIASGYRLIDTASGYRNEEAVGAAIRKCGIPREQLFITTKLWVQDYGYEDTKKAFETSLKKLGLDYIDLYLIHQPFGKYLEAYRAMEELYREGKIKAIGVSNFYPHMLADLCETVSVIPAVNQVEVHPFYHRDDLMKEMKHYGVCPEAWSPLASAKSDLFTNPILTSIGKKYGKTPAQVALRWNVQRGVVVIPKTVNKSRMVENRGIWDFKLTDEDMQAIAKLDTNTSVFVDKYNHYDPDVVRMFHGYKIHD
ncbi:2,5-diketo-D-gluconic acid reductase [Giardia muris]|uniref:2,5-diketo-D-gluconic acid reductase n=1 Tax=Giardia muris TaxID=5742 RepID=A0A4Z1T2C4_GIAMU|nr:2,5-diketo-D-gluconic acid reductase [Giardia muris]TNJ28083.1 2,5-diketo-D-gluconic acid reductase [Giardia muris]|eukprot:TNJ26458.1 2,5-diketo-D-gluconic acid reductase [Giardia muris]